MVYGGDDEDCNALTGLFRFCIKINNKAQGGGKGNTNGTWKYKWIVSLENGFLNL